MSLKGSDDLERLEELHCNSVAQVLLQEQYDIGHWLLRFLLHLHKFLNIIMSQYMICRAK